MKYSIALGWFLVVCNSWCQSLSTRDNEELYKDYREDQFYISITYNVLNNKIDPIAQAGFSPGFHFGFIRDMPINERRNVALGIGLGLSANSYNQNLSIVDSGSAIEFTVFNERIINVDKNRFSTYLVELPIEFRWRTSTPTKYSFWRIYAGMKLGYMFYNSAVLESSLGNQRLSNLDVFNRLQYGLTFSAGLNTWNLHLNYNLSSLFSDGALLNDAPIELAAFKIGLIFYLL
jgi:hypothetical protein